MERACAAFFVVFPTILLPKRRKEQNRNRVLWWVLSAATSANAMHYDCTRTPSNCCFLSLSRDCDFSRLHMQTFPHKKCIKRCFRKQLLNRIEMKIVLNRMHFSSPSSSLFITLFLTYSYRTINIAKYQFEIVPIHAHEVIKQQNI